MNQLTKFDRFHLAIKQSFGFPIEKLERELVRGNKRVKLDDVIPGKHGLYSLIEQDGRLFVTKIILHACDFPLHILDRTNNAAKLAFKNKDYDSQDLCVALHKYHLYYCQTIRQMFNDNRGHRYRQSHRQDGKFCYYFVYNNQRRKKRENQKLNFCKFCLKKFKLNAPTPLVGDDTFTPKDFFEIVSNSKWLRSCGNLPDTAPPPAYPSDFDKISEEVKKRRKYTCEQCSIFLEEPHFKKFLQCHHSDMDKTNNRTANLLCLCIKCHAEQPGHGHMKRLPPYLEFLPIWERISKETSSPTYSY